MAFIGPWQPTDSSAVRYEPIIGRIPAPVAVIGRVPQQARVVGRLPEVATVKGAIQS